MLKITVLYFDFFSQTHSKFNFLRYTHIFYLLLVIGIDRYVIFPILLIGNFEKQIGRDKKPIYKLIILIDIYQW